jgi:predicted TPR repeat methyltransferase
VLASPGRSLRIFDAGCGTGLCAQYVAPFARQLVGVDLTREMLERAAVRGGYDELVLGELVAFLDTRRKSCDVLISADTLCYFGSLEEFAAAASRCVVPGGWVVFTVEAHDAEASEPDYRLHHHGRYSHRRDYVESAMLNAGFVELSLREVTLRLERGKPVRGWLTRARVPQEEVSHV